jgi:hypothetical protein
MFRGLHSLEFVVRKIKMLGMALLVLMCSRLLAVMEMEMPLNPSRNPRGVALALSTLTLADAVEAILALVF